MKKGLADGEDFKCLSATGDGIHYVKLKRMERSKRDKSGKLTIGRKPGLV